MPPQSPDAGSDRFGYRAPPPPRRSWLKTLLWILAAIALAVLVGWGLTALKTHNAETAAAAGGPGGFGGGPGGPGGGGGRGGGGGGFGGGRGGGAPTTVGTAVAATGAMPITTDALGTVTPIANVNVQSRISGALQAVYFQEGQLVSKGQRLALIDPRPYEVAVSQAQATLMHDQALLAQARMDLKRYQTLLAQDSIARQTAEDQAQLVKQDEATVAADKASLENAKLNLSYCNITAPVAGRVGLRKTDVGNFVTASSTSIVVLTSVKPIDVQFALPEDELPLLQPRLRAGARLPVDAYDRSRVNVLAHGQFLTLDNTVATTTGTVSAKARFDNADGALFPSQFVNVHVLIDTLENVIVIPTSAVRHGAPGDFVYTVAGHTAHVSVVKLGPSAGETISVLSGLKAGDVVVTEGGDRLRDGGPVRLPTDCGPSSYGGGGGGAGGGHRGARGSGQGGGQWAGRGGAASGAPGAGAGAGACGPSTGAAGAAGGHRHGGGATASETTTTTQTTTTETTPAPGGAAPAGGHAHGAWGGHGGQGHGGQAQSGQPQSGQAPGQGGWNGQHRHRAPDAGAAGGAPS